MPAAPVVLLQGTPVCGFFVTALLEDQERDDSDGPHYDETTCEGIEPI